MKTNQSWLTPYWDEWKRVVGGNPTAGEMALRMRRLEKEHGAEKVLAHFKAYLERVDVQYASLKRFEETFLQWGNSVARVKPSANREVAERIKRRLAGGAD